MCNELSLDDIKKLLSIYGYKLVPSLFCCEKLIHRKAFMIRDENGKLVMTDANLMNEIHHWTELTCADLRYVLEHAAEFYVRMNEHSLPGEDDDQIIKQNIYHNMVPEEMMITYDVMNGEKQHG